VGFGTLEEVDKQLTIQEVEHVAKLAQLRLTDEQLKQYQNQLSTIIKHIDKLSELDVAGVEPIADSSDISNRLDEDNPVDSLTQSEVLSLMPQVEGEYLVVPKVLPGSDENA